MPQPQNSFLQSVFNEISLERDFKLWQSDDDKFVEKRIRFLSEFDETSFDNQLGRERPQLKKNEVLSNAFKNKGDEAQKSGDYTKAVSLYNAALTLAPDKTDLAYSIYMSRALTLKASQKFQEGLTDLILAEKQIDNSKNETTEVLKLELFTQFVKSNTKMSKDGATDIVETYRKALEDKDFPTLQKIESDLSKPSGRTDLPKLSSVNPSCKSFADSVLIRESEVQGRFTVAARDIPAGELLAIDEPVVTYLDAEFSKSHCWNCLKLTKIIIPCSNCSGVVFCSTICKMKAENTYHRLECGLTDLLYQSEIGVWILAYRTVASQPMEFFLTNSFFDVRQKRIETKDEFYEYCRLVTHEGARKFSAPELMKEALVSVFLTRCLARRNYFGNNAGSLYPFGPEQMSIALWIHRLMRIARFNCHELTQLDPNFTTADPKLKTRRIGVAINPNLALINHSCDPNYGRVWLHGENGKPRVYSYSTRPIAKGEEICDAYSGVFTIATKEERDTVHQRYHFQCCCVACNEDWPLLKDLSANIGKKKSDEKLKKLNQLIKLREKMRSKAPTEQLRWSVEAVSLSRSSLKLPHPIFYDMEEEVHKSLWFILHS